MTKSLLILIIGLSLGIVPTTLSLTPISGQDGGLWVQTCTGNWVSLDLSADGEAPDAPILPHAKACHALCHARDDMSDDESEI
ncbi:MAG: hypothetical protein V3U82_01205 [Robiginitomaculum sp.]